MERPDLYVVARFLERLSEAPAPPRKTDLQLRVRVNYTIFQRYLEWLAAKGYVEVASDADGTERIALTQRGRAAYSTLVAWIRDALGGDP
jgi:predicted transcriptional regulator